MTAAAGLALVNALLAGLETLIPLVSGWFKGGEISVEEQKAVFDRYKALRDAGDKAFEGEEWTITPDEPQASV